MAVKGRYSSIPRNIREGLRAAATAGGELFWVKEIFYGDHEPETSATRPYLYIHLDEPAMAEKWSGAKDQKDSVVRVVVEVQLDVADPEEPYGIPGDDETAKIGILTAIESVGNAIDAAGPGTLPGGGRAAIDYDLTARNVRKVEASTWRGEILVEARTRFRAGLR
jgi:hypothetical protein